MTLWQKIKRFFRQLAGKDLPKAIVENETTRIMRDKPLMEALRRARKEGSRSRSYEPLVTKEELARKEWLPKPTTRRRTRSRSYQPPAEQHRKAISKHMKGKGRHAPWYRKSIKKSPKLRMEEED